VCTDRPGSSSWFERGLVSYSNRAKQELLGVDAGVLNARGAVSEAVARQMAKGARRRSGADVAVAVTGIAGPDGGTAKKPVGTVWFGWSLAGGLAETEVVVFQGERDAVRRQSVARALQGLLDRM
jgi:nicotinamide-nucleotide amidase